MIEDQRKQVEEVLEHGRKEWHAYGRQAADDWLLAGDYPAEDIANLTQHTCPTSNDQLFTNDVADLFGWESVNDFIENVLDGYKEPICGWHDLDDDYGMLNAFLHGFVERCYEECAKLQPA